MPTRPDATGAGILAPGATPGDHVHSDATTMSASASFESFYRADRDRLVRMLAVNLGDVHLAAEAVDVAMSRAWARWNRLDDHDDAGAWVYRVARNWATSWFRGRRRISDGPVPDISVEPDQRPPPTDLRDALDGLSEPHRAVVTLRVLGGWSTAETARALDIPEGTVKSRLARALEQLRTSMEAPR